MLVVIALGGNALLQRGQPLDAQTQRANVATAAEAIAAIARDHRVVPSPGPRSVVDLATIRILVEHGGWLAGIGALADAAALLRGEAGTILRSAHAEYVTFSPSERGRQSQVVNLMSPY